MGVKSWGLIPDSTLLLMPLWANHLIEASVASFIACKMGMIMSELFWGLRSCKWKLAAIKLQRSVSA